MSHLWKLYMLKGGYDIDGVCADFHRPFYEEIGKKWRKPNEWNDEVVFKHFHKVRNKESFWLSLPTMDKPENPFCYITARAVSSHVTLKWLIDNKYPIRPVLTVEHSPYKLEILEMLDLDYFVDDKIDTIKQIEESEIRCIPILYCGFYSEYNHKYNVKYKVDRLADIPKLL